MAYAVKEIYYTLQGEGVRAGRPAVFLRFSGCNLWSGREADRDQALCRFCDTDFFGIDGPNGGKYPDAEGLARAVEACWPSEAGGRGSKYVVCTGGEPLLQLNEPLVAALRENGFEVAVETNGTVIPRVQVDWLCVSPKAGTELVIRAGNELKLVYPQEGAVPEQFVDLEFDHFLLQPMDGPVREENTRLALRYCLAHPWWRLSLQTHKILAIP